MQQHVSSRPTAILYGFSRDSGSASLSPSRSGRCGSPTRMVLLDLKTQKTASVVAPGQDVFYGLAISPDNHPLLYNQSASRGTETLQVENFQ